jgi:predicted RNase H-like nuclease
MKVAGIDGCKDRWVAVLLDDAGPITVRAFPNITAALAGLSEAAAIGIDMPLGLPADGELRQADLEAQKMLLDRRATIFRVPSRRVLEAPDYATAKERARPGPLPTRQLFGIAKKILEVNDCPLLDDRVFEVHPEVSFCAMGGKPAPSKKKWNGFWWRLRLLAGEGISLSEELENGLGIDDVLDAAAAAWSGLRKAKGTAHSLPAPPEIIEDRPVAIWY